jgi:hypothetical protein
VTFHDRKEVHHQAGATVTAGMALARIPRETIKDNPSAGLTELRFSVRGGNE